MITLETINRILKWLLVLVAIVCVASAGFWLWQKQSVQPSRPVATDSYGQFLTRNPSFAEGEKSRLNGDYSVAAQQLTQALSSASSVNEAGAIKLRIAIVQAQSGNKAAIQLYKEVAANPAYAPDVRAYAVEDLIIFLLSNGGQKDLVQETFKDEPYKSLYNPKSLTLTLRRTAEYASSIYPVADSELLIAAFYADDVTSLKKAKNPDTAKIALDLSTINQKLASADRDLQRIRSQGTNFQDTIPYILLQKANVLGKLEYAGEPTGTDPEQAYKEALDSYAMFKQIPGGDAYARYHYAAYLAKKLGVSGATQVHAVIAALYTDASYKNTSIESYLRNIRTSSKGFKKSAVDIALVDSGFKDYLITLGWKTTDFK